MKTVGYKGVQREHSSYCNTTTSKQDRFSTQTRQPSQSVMEEYAQTVPTPTLEENVRPRSEVMIADLVRAATLDKYKCRTEGDDDQQLSGTRVAALMSFLSEYRDETTLTPAPLLLRFFERRNNMRCEGGLRRMPNVLESHRQNKNAVDRFQTLGQRARDLNGRRSLILRTVTGMTVPVALLTQIQPRMPC